jgi:hypothetical protein
MSALVPFTEAIRRSMEVGSSNEEEEEEKDHEEESRQEEGFEAQDQEIRQEGHQEESGKEEVRKESEGFQAQVREESQTGCQEGRPNSKAGGSGRTGNADVGSHGWRRRLVGR